MRFAEVAAYYGWTDAEIAAMDRDLFDTYYRAREVLIHQELLLRRLPMSTWPWMKESHQSEKWKEWHKLAYPVTYSRKVGAVELDTYLKGVLGHGKHPGNRRSPKARRAPKGS